MKILLPLLVGLCFGCSHRASEPILEVETQPAESIAEERKNVAASPYTIEAATRLDFEKAKKNNPEAFTADTANFRKENGVLSLQIKDEWKLLTSFRDTWNAPESDDTDIREYKYLGQLKPINKYVVGGGLLGILRVLFSRQGNSTPAGISYLSFSVGFMNI